MKEPPEGCFYPYTEIEDGKLQDRRSPGDVAWYFSRKLRTVAMVQDYKVIIESYRRVQDKRQITKMLLSRMNEQVRGAGGQFTVILFDMDQEQRSDYRKHLESEGIRFVDFDRPELADKTLRQPDGHPTARLNELLAQTIEPLVLVPASASKGPETGEAK
jgi:hypothetical protein